MINEFNLNIGDTVKIVKTPYKSARDKIGKVVYIGSTNVFSSFQINDFIIVVAIGIERYQVMAGACIKIENNRQPEFEF